MLITAPASVTTAKPATVAIPATPVLGTVVVPLSVSDVAGLLVSVVVSEENGVISTAKSGKIKRYMTPEALEEEVLSALKGEDLEDIGV